METSARQRANGEKKNAARTDKNERKTMTMCKVGHVLPNEIEKHTRRKSEKAETVKMDSVHFNACIQRSRQSCKKEKTAKSRQKIGKMNVSGSDAMQTFDWLKFMGLGKYYRKISSNNLFVARRWSNGVSCVSNDSINAKNVSNHCFFDTISIGVSIAFSPLCFLVNGM